MPSRTRVALEEGHTHKSSNPLALERLEAQQRSQGGSCPVSITLFLLSTHPGALWKNSSPPYIPSPGWVAEFDLTKASITLVYSKCKVACVLSSQLWLPDAAYQTMEVSWTVLTRTLLQASHMACRCYLFPEYILFLFILTKVLFCS